LSAILQPSSLDFGGQSAGFSVIAAEANAARVWSKALGYRYSDTSNVWDVEGYMVFL
jgi:hypothetical protein